MKKLRALLVAIISFASSSQILAASLATATADIQIISAESLGKTGAPLPSNLVELSLPFYSEKECNSKVFFPKTTVTRLDLAESSPYPFFTPDIGTLVSESQTFVQGLFKKIPTTKEIQRTARELMLKQKLSAELGQDSTQKLYDTKWSSIDIPSSVAVLVLDGRSPDAQAKTKVLETIKARNGKGNIVIDSPMDIERARTIIAKALCADVSSGANISVILVSKLPKVVVKPPQKKVKTPQKNVNTPQKPSLNCYKVPGMDKEICTRDTQPAK